MIRRFERARLACSQLHYIPKICERISPSVLVPVLPYLFDVRRFNPSLVDTARIELALVYSQYTVLPLNDVPKLSPHVSEFHQL